MFSKQNQSQIFPAADRGGRQRTEQHELQRTHVRDSLPEARERARVRARRPDRAQRVRPRDRIGCAASWVGRRAAEEGENGAGRVKIARHSAAKSSTPRKVQVPGYSAT